MKGTMVAVGKLRLLKSIGNKQWAIFGNEGQVLAKIDIDNWLIDRIGNAVHFRMDYGSISIRDIEIYYETVGG